MRLKSISLFFAALLPLMPKKKSHAYSIQALNVRAVRVNSLCYR
jgi:hypothetical protein